MMKEWFKKHWWKVLIGILVLTFAATISGLALNKIRNLTQLNQVTQSSYEQQLEVMKNLHDEELRKRDELLLDYEKQIRDLEKDYQEKYQELEEKQKELIKDYTSTYKKDPAKLSKIIEEQLGVKYVP